MPVLNLKRVSVKAVQRCPIETLRHDVGAIEWCVGLLVRHLEEKEEGQLLDVVLIGQAVVAKDIAVIPKLLDDGCAVHAAVTFACLARCADPA